MKTFSNVIEPPVVEHLIKEHHLRGKWKELFFGNNHPLVLELACGKGEYTVGLANRYPEKNFIGIDIKGARMWRGAKTATKEKILNAGFLRTRIEFAGAFFAPGEVDEIWITFPDPQPKKALKRLTSSRFLSYYQQFLKPGHPVHLKTDNKDLFQYSYELVKYNELRVEAFTRDLNKEQGFDDARSIQTYYEEKFLAEGLKIQYMCFLLPHEKELQEPPES